MTGRNDRITIFILSGPVQSGKTTRLRGWCERHGRTGEGDLADEIDGILAPIVDGKRHLVDIRSGEMQNLEDVPAGGRTEPVGKYVFNNEVFEWACERLLSIADTAAVTGSRSPQTRWIIIDEIGPLELAGGGLGPAVRSVFEAPWLDPVNIVLVIREHLVEEVLAHYAISEDHVQRFPHA